MLVTTISLIGASFRFFTADPEKTASKMISPETDEAIEGGLQWLADRQHDDGSFGSGAYRGNVAVTALSAMAMMSSGSTPGRGPYGAQVDRAVDYLISKTQQSGFVSASEAASHGPMYGHGFATLVLAESYGMSARPELREKLIYGNARRLLEEAGFEF